jgi:hypothetical protein
MTKKRGFPMTNPQQAGIKSGAGVMAEAERIGVAPIEAYPDNFEVDGTKNRDQSAVNGDFSGVSEGPVSCDGMDHNKRVAPKSGDDTPGGGW